MLFVVIDAGGDDVRFVFDFVNSHYVLRTNREEWVAWECKLSLRCAGRATFRTSLYVTSAIFIDNNDLVSG